MYLALEENRVLERIEAYFEMLKKMGYVKHGTTSKYMLYVFLYDFVETVYDFMTEEDYETVSNVLRGIFSGSDCLLPYQDFDEARSKAKIPHLGISNIRRVSRILAEENNTPRLV